MDDLFDCAALTDPVTSLASELGKSGGRGRYEAVDVAEPMSPPDPLVSFAPLLAIRPRSARARVDVLEALAVAEEEWSTALRSMVQITDAHTAAFPAVTRSPTDSTPRCGFQNLPPGRNGRWRCPLNAIP